MKIELKKLWTTDQSVKGNKPSTGDSKQQELPRYASDALRPNHQLSGLVGGSHFNWVNN